MGLPHLLLVDDSEAILKFEMAVLSATYQLSTAMNGHEALDKIRSLKPDAVLLDLSMPEMDGDEVFKIIREDAGLSHIPFLVVSSERARAEACLAAGAEGYLAKPVQAEELRARVALILDQAHARQREKHFACVLCGVGGYTMGLPLEKVMSVHSQPATRQFPAAPNYAEEYVEIYGEPVAVLDMAAALGVEHSSSIVERKLVLIQDKTRIALCVDRVWDPEELPWEQVRDPATLGLDEHGKLGKVLIGVAPTSHGSLPVVDPTAFFSQTRLKDVAKALAALKKQAPAGV